VGKDNGPRECAPDGVPTILRQVEEWWARRKGAFCPPYGLACVLDKIGLNGINTISRVA
jgi:hypothetical protein